MTFIDKNGILSDVTFLKSGFDEAEFIDIDCKNMFRYHKPSKSQIKNYAFFKLNDAIINGKAFDKFKIELIKLKRTRRKKLGVLYYIIDTDAPSHLPIINFTTAYEGWKNGGILPNGIFVESYFINFYGNLESKEKLIKYWKIDKKIIIIDECDYTIK